MLIRYAEFVGTIKAGKQEEFYDFVETTLTPLLTKFDGAVNVSVCRELERDEGAPSIPLLLAIYRQETLPDECAPLLQEALVRGEFERGEASRITGLPDRSARRVLKALTDEGLLASVTEKGPVSLRFPVQALDTLFPRLYPEDV